MNQKIGKNKIGRMTPRLHGHTKIVFTDKFGRETVKLDKDNLVTDAVQKIFESNYFGSIDYSQLMPAIRKTLGGVILFENTLGNDATDIWIPKSYDNPITGHAGQTVPASLADDTTRGLPNSAASTAISNGYKMVWNFPETQGNGDIAAVGLCHSDFGDYALNDSAFTPLEMISNDSIKSVSFLNDYNREKVINLYDSVNGYSYSIYNTNIRFGADGQEYTTQYNVFNVIKRKNSILNNLSVDMSHYIGNDEGAERFNLIYDTGTVGTLTDFPLPSFYIDHTNNLLWLTFATGHSSIGGDGVKAVAAAYDMAKFINGANVNPEFTQSPTDVKGAVLGSNLPLQAYITESAEGYIPAIIWDNGAYKLTLASYDDVNKEFALESLTPIELATSLRRRFPVNIGLGNYYLVRGTRQADFTKLVEFDIANDNNKVYDVSTPAAYISPYYYSNDNPIIGATCWTYGAGFTMGKSGTAINKLYLATKNDLPATITKTAANSMRVEYTLTYV